VSFWDSAADVLVDQGGDGREQTIDNRTIFGSQELQGAVRFSKSLRESRANLQIRRGEKAVTTGAADQHRKPLNGANDPGFPPSPILSSLGVPTAMVVSISVVVVVVVGGTGGLALCGTVTRTARIAAETCLICGIATIRSAVRAGASHIYTRMVCTWKHSPGRAHNSRFLGTPSGNGTHLEWQLHGWTFFLLGRSRLGPRDRGLEKRKSRIHRKTSRPQSFFETDGQRGFARSLGSASWRARERMSDDLSVDWRSAAGSYWTETLAIHPGRRKIDFATTARTYELSGPIERPAAEHTRIIAVD
jgi:hypothetical protein